MKTIKKIIKTGFSALILLFALSSQSKAQGDYISDQDFYDNLQPYGTWVSDPQYGNVWIPDVDGDFRPYATRGHWVVTDYGNTWVSDYPWGWATFHYGRWRYDDYYGWEWIPGHEWAPAWVSWRHGGGYYGWAPLLPGITIAISIGGGYHVPDNYWVCAPQAYINRPNIYNYYVPPSRSVTIIRNTTIINNTYVQNNVTYVTGPRPQEIRQYTRQNVTVYNINNSNRPGNVTINNKTVNIYRPAVNKAPDARPARVVDANAYRQQHPNQPIANRGSGGAPSFNRANAAKLASVAKAPMPDNKIVRVNPVNNRPAQQMPNRGTQPNKPQADKSQPNQPTRQAQQQAPQKNNQQPQRQQPAQQNQQRQQQAQQKTAQQAQQQDQQKAAQQAQQRQQQVQQQQAQQKAAQQQTQQTQQQQAQQKAAQQQAQQRQQQTQQQQAQQKAAQQQAQQRQQQAQQQQAQQKAAQQQAQQRQQQAQQQQAQQKAAQQQAQQRQQQAQQQAQQQQAQQKAAQQAQQRQQQAQQQQAQQKAAQQQAQQRQQQQQKQQQQKQQQQKPKPEEQPRQQ